MSFFCGLAAWAFVGFRPKVDVPKPTSAMILTYHDVIPRRGPSAVWFDCTLDELRGQMEWMTRHGAHFVTLAQIEAHLLKGAPLPSHAVAVTFADNYRGFLLAYPYLRKHRIPSAMFVHTGYVGSKVGRPKMTWEELKRLDREGWVTVSSQTVTHRDLPTLDDATVKREMVDSKAKLQRELGHSIRYLAYPNGHFDSRSVREAQRAGYALAFSEVQAPVDRSASRWTVNRYVHTKWRRAWKDAFHE